MMNAFIPLRLLGSERRLSWRLLVIATSVALIVPSSVGAVILGATPATAAAMRFISTQGSGTREYGLQAGDKSGSTERALLVAQAGAAGGDEAGQSFIWASKAAFLDAARAGQLTGLPRVMDSGQTAELAQVLRSILWLLRQDYGVPAIPEMSRCYSEYREVTKQLVRSVTLGYIETLGSEGPDFMRRSTQGPAVQASVTRLSQSGGWCDGELATRGSMHPYKRALLQLMSDYGLATKAFVEDRRRQAKEAYQLALAKGEEIDKARIESRSRQEAAAQAQAEDKVKEEQARAETSRKAEAERTAQWEADKAAKAQAEAAAKEAKSLERARIVAEVRAGKRKPADCDELMVSRGIEQVPHGKEVMAPALAKPEGLGIYVGQVEQIDDRELILNVYAAAPFAQLQGIPRYVVLQTGRDTFTFDAQSIRVGSVVSGYGMQATTRNTVLTNGQSMTVAVIHAVCMSR